MRKAMVTLLIALALSGAVAAQQAGKQTKMYKWTDENGTVHYSEKPVDEAKAEEVPIRSGPSVEAAAAAPAANPAEVARCAQLKENLRLLESNASDLQIADNGTTRPLTAEERQLQLDATKRALEGCVRVPAPAPAQPPNN